MTGTPEPPSEPTDAINFRDAAFKCDALGTEIRINNVLTHLNMLVRGEDPDAQRRQDQPRRPHVMRRISGSSSDEELFPFQRYRRQYIRRDTPRSPTTISPTPSDLSPPFSPLPDSKYEAIKRAFEKHDRAVLRKQRKKNESRRRDITKNGIKKHHMITRSRAKPGLKLESLSRFSKLSQGNSQDTRTGSSVGTDQISVDTVHT